MTSDNSISVLRTQLLKLDDIAAADKSPADTAVTAAIVRTAEADALSRAAAAKGNQID